MGRMPFHVCVPGVAQCLRCSWVGGCCSLVVERSVRSLAASIPFRVLRRNGVSSSGGEGHGVEMSLRNLTSIVPLLLTLACQNSERPPADDPGSTPDPAPPRAVNKAESTAVEPASPSPTASDSTSAAAQAVPVGRPCGELACTRYPDARSALLAVLAREPQVLGVGEAHALKGTEGIASATVRFEQQLLPLLAERGATELIVELLGPAQGCTKAVETVRKEQEQVVEKQAETNQNRFISLGHAARKLSVVPYILEPTCEEFEAVAKGGADGITRMLELIAVKTQAKLSAYWQRNTRPEHAADASVQPTAPEPKGEAPAPTRRFTAAQRHSPLVLAYGGALHNDIHVSEQKQKFTYGKNMLQLTGGRYIALDLIVPEYIKPTDVWMSLPWYEHFDAANPPAETTLFQTDEHSYVLIFGRSETQPTPPQTPEP